MALKPLQDKIKNNSIKKYDNQDLSKQATEDNKKKSKLRQRKSCYFYEPDFYAEINNNISVVREPPPGIITMGTYYSPTSVIPNYALPYTGSQWDILPLQIPSPLYTVPVPTVPLSLISPPIMPSVVPFTDVLYTPAYSPVMSYVADNVCTGLDHIYEPMSSFAAFAAVATDEECIEIKEIAEEEQNDKIKPLEYYLTLPKNLFPRAKMLTLDPNPIIDELCKLKDINKHSSWILDLEFGVPRASISRPVAVYDVQFNNIHCKNSPGTVHPVFESCSEVFKKLFLFYYDCIVSVWYRGYIRIRNDDSVMNFQNWLMVPMHALGMCWP